jgi:protein-S-isoprenylcysteine O-methyltransferase Ste14
MRIEIMNLLKAQNGMNIIGQGGRIIFFALPFALAAILIHLYFPKIASLPQGLGAIRPAGYVFLFFGIALWITGLIQLLKDFPKGRLITTGAYGICRNPIYASMIVFILPAISLFTLTWVYLFIAIILYVGVVIFIPNEENQLLQVFGNDYIIYKSKVSRVLPFGKP